MAELHPDQQVKLLRVLHGREYFPVGSNRPKTADVRIIAATNKDLRKLREQGSIRDDNIQQSGTPEINQ